MKLYHSTTEKKAKKYRETGHICKVRVLYGRT